MKFNTPFIAFGLILILNLGSLEAQITTSSMSNSDIDSVRWKKLMVLVDNEIKTIRDNPYSGPELKHRLFELYSEKIKLIKEKENEKMLKASSKDVIKNGKESFFKSSHAQYKMAQSYALTIISQYPKYERLADIYYALAINSRDYGTSFDTEKYLKLAISHTTESGKTMYKAKTALAEYYYNNKQYNEAINFYNDVLKNTSDEWYGKHLYNAGWCHLKERNFKKALELVKLSFETTKISKFVSMKEQIFNAIGIFFVQADATYEGIDFLEKHMIPSSSGLISLAQSSMNKNNFSITQEVLKAALKDSRKRKDANAEIKVRLAELDIYRESKKDELYFEVANSILELHKKSKLATEDISIAQNKIKEVAGFMQINLIKDKKKDSVVYNKEDYKKIMRYFDILAILDQANKTLYRYYQGETALSAHEYQVALKYYIRSIMNAKLDHDNGETTRKSLDAMLATLDLTKVPKLKENEYTIFAFKNFLLFYPVSDKSQAIYQKLFNKYFEIKDTKKAVNTLFVYKHHYKSDEAIHREMLTQILDSYIKQKNADKLAFWIEKIEKGYLNFQAEYIQNSIAILGGLLFDKYQALEKKGQLKEAVEGYESIYDSKQYPRRTKAEAAYAIAALSLEQNNGKHSHKWLLKSLELYDDKDLIKVTGSLYTLAKGYRLLQNFDLSRELAQNISRRFCKDSFESKDNFYQLASENLIIQKESIQSIIVFENEFKKCNVNEKIISKTQSENLERLIYADRYTDVLAYFRDNSKNSQLQKMMDKYLRFKFFQFPNTFKKDIESLTGIDLGPLLSQHQNVLDFVQKVENMKFIFTNEEKFNEEKYNLELEQYFTKVSELNNEAIALSKSSSPEQVIMIRNILSKPYFSLVKAIKNYSPNGVDKRYLEGFSQGMRQITESLMTKGLQIDREKMDFLEKNNYFFEVQKNDIVNTGNSKRTLDQALNFHSVILFSNTLDISQ